MLLALDEEWVDDRAAVVDGDVADEAGLAGLDVDLGDGDVRAEGERRPVALEHGVGGERVVVELGRPAGQLGPGERGRRYAGDAHRAGGRVDDDVGRVGLEQPRGEVLRPLDDGGRRLVHGRTTELQRS